MEEWDSAEEARRLKLRFAGVKQAEFARAYEIPGGPSMVNQHLKGHRPISLAAAIKYAAAFGVSLADISPRHARLHVAATPRAESTVTRAEETTVPSYDVVGRHEISGRQWALLRAVEILFSDEEQAEMVRRAERLRAQARTLEDAIKK